MENERKDSLALREPSPVDASVEHISGTIVFKADRGYAIFMAIWTALMSLHFFTRTIDFPIALIVFLAGGPLLASFTALLTLLSMEDVTVTPDYIEFPKWRKLLGSPSLPMSAVAYAEPTHGRFSHIRVTLQPSEVDYAGTLMLPGMYKDVELKDVVRTINEYAGYPHPDLHMISASRWWKKAEIVIVALLVSGVLGLSWIDLYRTELETPAVARNAMVQPIVGEIQHLEMRKTWYGGREWYLLFQHDGTSQSQTVRLPKHLPCCGLIKLLKDLPPGSKVEVSWSERNVVELLKLPRTRIAASIEVISPELVWEAYDKGLFSRITGVLMLLFPSIGAAVFLANQWRRLSPDRSS